MRTHGRKPRGADSPGWYLSASLRKAFLMASSEAFFDSPSRL